MDTEELYIFRFGSFAYILLSDNRVMRMVFPSTELVHVATKDGELMHTTSEAVSTDIRNLFQFMDYIDSKKASE